MFRFIESIKLFEGTLQLLDLHENRMNATRAAFYENTKALHLKDALALPCEYDKGLYKVRIEYGKYLENIDIQPYEVKSHKRVRLIFDDEISYEFKSVERSIFDNYLKENPDCEDVIFIKSGYLTDASYSNLVLYNGENWITPHAPLLEGIKRKYLLKQKQIVEAEIGLGDLVKFQKIGFINAMRDFEKIYSFVIEGESINLLPTR